MAVAVASSTPKLTDVDKNRRLAPPLAASPPGTGTKAEWMSPYSGRGA
jgi:hypothetical protein